MNLIKSSVEEWVQENSLQGAYKQIEKAARVCYKSDLGKNPAGGHYLTALKMVSNQKRREICCHYRQRQSL